MPLSSIPPSETPPRLANKADTMFEDTVNHWYIQDDTRQLLVTDENMLIGPLATISPAECLRFQVVDHTRETVGPALKIFNNSTKQNIAFKVKSTTPANYVVRPNIGIIKPEETVDIALFLRPDFDGTIHPAVCHDKFLIQLVEVKKNVTSVPALTDMLNKLNWKAKTYMQHKLWCALEHPQAASEEWRVFQAQLAEVTQLFEAKKANKERDEDKFLRKVNREMKLKNQDISVKLQVANKELKEMDRRHKKLVTEKDFILRYMLFQFFLMVFLALVLFVIILLAYNTDTMDDSARCADSFSTACVFPTLPFW